MTEASEPEPRARPPAQYGEYAPPGWVSPNAHLIEPPAPPPAAGPTRRPPRWDRPLTVALLILGGMGMAFGVFGGTNLSLILEQAAALQGVELELPSWAGVAGTVIVVSHVVLYAAAVIGSGMLLRRGRTAFWLPLAAGVLAALIYHGVTGALGIAAGLVGGAG